MAVRMGVREFRDNFTTIAREAREPVIVTNHDKVIGYYTPSESDPSEGIDWEGFRRRAEAARRELEVRGVDVAGFLKELGVEEQAKRNLPSAQRRGPRATKRRTGKSGKGA